MNFKGNVSLKTTDRNLTLNTSRTFVHFAYWGKLKRESTTMVYLLMCMELLRGYGQ